MDRPILTHHCQLCQSYVIMVVHIHSSPSQFNFEIYHGCSHSLPVDLIWIYQKPNKENWLCHIRINLFLQDMICFSMSIDYFHTFYLEFYKNNDTFINKKTNHDLHESFVKQTNVSGTNIWFQKAVFANPPNRSPRQVKLNSDKRKIWKILFE